MASEVSKHQNSRVHLKIEFLTSKCCRHHSSNLNNISGASGLTRELRTAKRSPPNNPCELRPVRMCLYVFPVCPSSDIKMRSKWKTWDLSEIKGTLLEARFKCDWGGVKVRWKWDWRKFIASFKWGWSGTKRGFKWDWSVSVLLCWEFGAATQAPRLGQASLGLPWLVWASLGWFGRTGS